MVDRTRRLIDVNRLVLEGVSTKDIAKKLDINLQTAQKFVKYLDKLAVSELSSEEVGQRRSEIDLEYIEAIEEAKKLFFRYKDPEIGEDGTIIRDAKPSIAEKFLERWTTILQQRAKLYGLDNIKIEHTQFNQFNTQQNKYDLREDQINSIADALVRGK